MMKPTDKEAVAILIDALMEIIAMRFFEYGISHSRMKKIAIKAIAKVKDEDYYESV